MFAKLGLTVLAEKAFEKAGGVEGIVAKGKKAAATAKERGQQIQKAFKDKSVEEGASVIGALAKDLVDTAKDAGQAAYEIGHETVDDATEAYEKAKEIWANVRNGEQAATAEEKAEDLATMMTALEKNPMTGATTIEAYYNTGNTLSNEDAITLTAAVADVDDGALPEAIKDMLVEMISNNIEIPTATANENTATATNKKNAQKLG